MCQREGRGNTKLNNYTDAELCEIYENLNTWKWDTRLGDKPKRWDGMPRYNHHWYHKVLRRKTKTDYVDPILRQIRDVVPEKEISRYRCVNVLKMPNETFEQWWLKNGEFHSNW